jgi:hypothetical protein
MQYHEDEYDAPAPTSYFRRQGRPWSPDAHDPLPTLPRHHDRQYRPHDDAPSYGAWSGGRQQQQRRREASEESVEALDLADYSRIAQAHSSRYVPFRRDEREYPEYPPSPPPARPFSAMSHDTPSLVSSPDTLSSQQSYARTGPSHRPFSLPPPSSYTSLRTPPTSHAHSDPRIRRSLDSVHEHGHPPPPGAEFDLARFPAWSRHWYDDDAVDKPAKRPRASDPPPSRAAFFDPGFAADPSAGFFDPYLGSAGAASSRGADLLPWSQRDSVDGGAQLGEDIKEERMRMLEREFGPDAPGARPPPPTRVVGSVDERGNLITQGPRKRLAVRALEILLAVAVAASALYAVLVRCSLYE